MKIRAEPRLPIIRYDAAHLASKGASPTFCRAVTEYDLLLRGQKQFESMPAGNRPSTIVCRGHNPVGLVVARCRTHYTARLAGKKRSRFFCQVGLALDLFLRRVGSIAQHILQAQG